ncbi:hypothetical protein GQ43DRAFT_158083 [Delitschia confertaspora ATCC 74209]|uniref:Uncharacterized protein n=1 Tax=Delitschia confertaspora ATCC 74209 TaxID=1513339 RepID=A0A9P4JU71_9PLEO|nr:hypothetical protein GQ43DRAFT_158083 [Delitschia confertaspora ATCC 74209]
MSVSTVLARAFSPGHPSASAASYMGELYTLANPSSASRTHRTAMEGVRRLSSGIVASPSLYIHIDQSNHGRPPQSHCLTVSPGTRTQIAVIQQMAISPHQIYKDTRPLKGGDDCARLPYIFRLPSCVYASASLSGLFRSRTPVSLHKIALFREGLSHTFANTHSLFGTPGGATVIEKNTHRKAQFSL